MTIFDHIDFVNKTQSNICLPDLSELNADVIITSHHPGLIGGYYKYSTSFSVPYTQNFIGVSDSQSDIESIMDLEATSYTQSQIDDLGLIQTFKSNVFTCGTIILGFSKDTYKVCYIGCVNRTLNKGSYKMSRKPDIIVTLSVQSTENPGKFNLAIQPSADGVLSSRISPSSIGVTKIKVGSSDSGVLIYNDYSTPGEIYNIESNIVTINSTDVVKPLVEPLNTKIDKIADTVTGYSKLYVSR